MELFNIIANCCSVVGFAIGIPGLILIYREQRRVAVDRARSSWSDMVKFTNIRDDVGITIADFSRMPFLPRVGEEISLPEITSLGALETYRQYQIVRVHYVCFSNDNGDAELGNVHVGVEPVLLKGT